MVKYEYVDGQQMHEFICKTKIEALQHVTEHWNEDRVDKPLPYQLIEDGEVIINHDQFNELYKINRQLKGRDFTTDEQDKLVEDVQQIYRQRMN